MRSDVERRRHERRRLLAAEPLAVARLRTGRELMVLDVSESGALVEGTPRLLPGTHLDLHLLTRHGRLLVRGRVTRAHVCHVAADVIRYRSAVAFESSVDTAAPD